MPGQAPQGPMPGMMPQQGAPTPGAMVAPLKTMSSDQLKLMVAQKPSWAILTAYNEALKREAREAERRGQQAQMAAAPTQGRTVKDDLLAQPVMAAYGGMMQGYASGGAVAFGGGGAVQHFRNGSDENGIQSFMERFPEDSGARRLYEWIKAGRPRLEKPILDALLQKEQQVAALPTPEIPITPAANFSRFRPQEIESYVRQLGPQPAGPQPTVGQREGVQRSARTQSPGLPGLMGPQIDSYDLEGRNAASEYQAALQKAGQLSPEQIAARGKIDEAMSGRKRFLGTEEQRRETLAEKRLQEALERSRVNPLEDITFIGQMLEGMRGTKRFGEGLAGLASGAGRAQAGRQAAVRAAEEKYDLSRNEIFKLQDARNQLDMDEAKLAEARATGDTDKINAAAANVAKSKMDYAKVQGDINDRALGRRLERERIDVEREKILAATEGTRAAREGTTQQRLMGMMASAEAKKQELIRKITEDHKDANKQVYLMASIPGAKVTPEMMAQKQDLDRQLALKIRSATSDLDKMIAQTASQIPGFGSLYGTSGGGLPAGVTVEKVGN